MLGSMQDGAGIHGTVMHYALLIALTASALLVFVYCWLTGRLDMSEEAKQQMMEETHDSADRRENP